MATLIDCTFLSLDLKKSLKVLMQERDPGYQNVISQGGYPIALVSIVTTLWEKSLLLRQAYQWKDLYMAEFIVKIEW